MILATQYASRSAIVNGLREGRVHFAANRLREPTFLRGRLAQPVLLREALAALYAVVVSNLKYQPRDRAAFKAWLEQQDRLFLAKLGMKNTKAQQKLMDLEARLGQLDEARRERLKPFEKARQRYVQFALRDQFERRFVYDPVITVHPDEVSFEAFSRDESTYARLAAKFDLFDQVDEFQCGTTNIDFSARLHGELERMRSYRRTRFDIDPAGFAVLSEGSSHQEKKIDLPDSWVMGFLQVHSTMTLGLTRFHMAPVDLFNLCRFLRRHKVRKSPRALRYELTPGQPVRAVLEPWEHPIDLTAAPPFVDGKAWTLEMTPGAIYEGSKPTAIRTWGRDRLLTVARLLPLCRRVDVYLAGFGMPSVYVLDLGPITFTLALSGWTDNDWTCGGGKFELLSRRLTVAAAELALTHEAMRTLHFASDGTVAAATGLGLEKTRSALSYLCQVGRAMFDLGGGVYRHRELFPEPFTVKEALAAIKPATQPKTPQEQAAKEIFQADAVRIIARRPVSTGFKLSGSARGTGTVRVRPLMHIDGEGKIIEATCTCAYFHKHKLTLGPCEHILALRLAHMARLENEDQEGG